MAEGDWTPSAASHEPPPNLRPLDRAGIVLDLTELERGLTLGMYLDVSLRDNAQCEDRDCGVTPVLRRSLTAVLADLSRT